MGGHLTKHSRKWLLGNYSCPTFPDNPDRRTFFPFLSLIPPLIPQVLTYSKTHYSPLYVLNLMGEEHRNGVADIEKDLRMQ